MAGTVYVADPADPSASRLLLADHETSPLTVVDVARLRLDNAGLAFLSACETARPGRRLTDEAIHLASAFQLAGYKHVVGTLWPIGDRHAVTFADDIYTTLTARDTATIPAIATTPAATTATGTTGSHVTSAVHEATRRLREEWLAWPSVWASHIHAGI